MQIDDITILTKICNKEIHTSNEVGNALHEILNKITKEPKSTSIDAITSYRNCLNCKYCHSEEIYDYQWGRFFAGNHRCDKGKPMPEKFSIGNASIDCDCYEQGQGVYDKIDNK